MLAQPMSHGGLAPIYRGRDFRSRQAGVDKCFQLLLRKAASRSVTHVPVGAKPWRSTQYETVDSCLSSLLPISANESPSPSICSKTVRSMHCMSTTGRTEKRTYVPAA